MLVNSLYPESRFSGNLLYIIHPGIVNPELAIRAAGNYVIMVPGANIWIYADTDISSGKFPSKHLQLGQ